MAEEKNKNTGSQEATEAVNTDTVKIVQDKPEKFESDLDLVKDCSDRISRDEEFGFNNARGNISLKRDGQISLSSCIDSQFKVSANGTIESISLNNNIKTNFFKIDADDIIVNNHKFNNKIIDLADFKQVLKTEWSTDICIVGGLTMLGTVLTRTWDKNLKRYVLIRRLANIPVFSPSFGTIDVHPGLQITPSTERIKAMQNEFKNSGIDMEAYIKAKGQEYANQKKTETSSDSNTKNQTEDKKANDTVTTPTDNKNAEADNSSEQKGK